MRVLDVGYKEARFIYSDFIFKSPRHQLALNNWANKILEHNPNHINYKQLKILDDALYFNFVDGVFIYEEVVKE